MARSNSGRMGEDAAADFLCGEGYTIVERNFHSRFGEIDIIAVKGNYIIFAEVKTRLRNSMLKPCEAVDARKQSRIIMTAKMYLSVNDIGKLQPRFDVIEVFTLRGGTFKIEKINHMKNAFST